MFFLCFFFLLLFVLFCFSFVLVLLLLLLFLFVCLFFEYCLFFVCIFVFIYLFFGLFISWFAYVSVMYVTACFFSYSFIFVVAASGGAEGCVLLCILCTDLCVLFPFALMFFSLFFPRGKGYFILHFGRVRDSSSAGQSLTFVSILEAYISFEGGCEGVAVSKNYLLLYIS